MRRSLNACLSKALFSQLVQVIVCFEQLSTMSMEKEKVANEEVHRIRITLTSTKVKPVEKGRRSLQPRRLTL